jgi:hypothetical protein
MTNKEAAARLGCSVTTARSWTCAWCGQDYLSIAHGHCGAIYEECDIERRVAAFVEKRRASFPNPPLPGVSP